MTHPRRSKKGRVSRTKVDRASGGYSITLKVPSDLNPDETDAIEIYLSRRNQMKY